MLYGVQTIVLKHYVFFKAGHVKTCWMILSLCCLLALNTHADYYFLSMGIVMHPTNENDWGGAKTAV